MENWIAPSEAGPPMSVLAPRRSSIRNMGEVVGVIHRRGAAGRWGMSVFDGPAPEIRVLDRPLPPIVPVQGLWIVSVRGAISDFDRLIAWMDVTPLREWIEED